MVFPHVMFLTSILFPGKYVGMGQDPETVVTNDCIRYKTATAEQQSTTSSYADVPPSVSQPTDNAKDSYNPLNLRMGQLTIYRINIQCSCRVVKPNNEICANILPFEQQSWLSYMGKNGDGYFSPRY